MTHRRWISLGAFGLGTLALGAFGLLLGLLYAHAQSVTNPTPIAAVCAYSASPPTVTTGQFVYVQCDSSGSLLLH